MTAVISVENLSKVYRLGQIGTGTFANDLKLWWARRSGKPNPLLKVGETDHGNRVGEDLWALKDVSFTVEQGQVLGIIGRNGAGKSTLLKILSRVTAPTSGRVRLKGRVASLLEVGTGFHPDLTGRENIHLNGAILGMDRREIDRKFDEIVAFAELEPFIDTPVKRYSSGMYVRLAFAVAAHLEPEILIVDEVLAVGDAEFQKKCLGKMGDVAKEGRTVLFVSHNMLAVNSLCSNCLMLNKGGIAALGEPTTIVNSYLGILGSGRGESIWEQPEEAPGNHLVRLHAVRVLSDGVICPYVDIDRELLVHFEYWVTSPQLRLVIQFRLLDEYGNVVLESFNTDEANTSKDPLYYQPLPIGLYRTVCKIPGNFLNDRKYFINLKFVTLNPTRAQIDAKEVISFHVRETGRMRTAGLSGKWLGMIRTPFEWKTEEIPFPGKESDHTARTLGPIRITYE